MSALVPLLAFLVWAAGHLNNPRPNRHAADRKRAA